MTSSQKVKLLEEKVYDLHVEKKNTKRLAEARDAFIRDLVCQHINILELQHKKSIELIYTKCDEMIYISNDKVSALKLELQHAGEREDEMNLVLRNMDEEIETLRYENEDLVCEIQNGRDDSEDEIRKLKGELRKLRMEASLSKLNEVELVNNANAMNHMDALDHNSRMNNSNIESEVTKEIQVMPQTWNENVKEV